MPYGLKYENPIDFTLAQHEILKQNLLISPHMAKFIDVPAAWAGVRYPSKRTEGLGGDDSSETLRPSRLGYE